MSADTERNITLLSVAVVIYARGDMAICASVCLAYGYTGNYVAACLARPLHPKSLSQLFLVWTESPEGPHPDIGESVTIPGYHVAQIEHSSSDPHRRTLIRFLRSGISIQPSRESGDRNRIAERVHKSSSSGPGRENENRAFQRKRKKP